METKANYARLGAATLLGLVFILLFALWLGDSGLRRGFAEYEVVFDDPVRGLAVGGEVRFNGIKVGEVKALNIDPANSNRVIAQVRISSDIPVRADSKAQLEPIGLTGVTLIQLSPGTQGAARVRQAFGAPIPRIVGQGSQIDVLVARSEDIALRASEAMAAVRDLLTDENIARVARILADLENVSHRLADQRSVIARSAETAQALTDAANAMASLSRRAEADMVSLDSAIAEVRGAAQVASGQTLPELAAAAEGIRSAADAITRVARNIDENPSVLTPRTPRPVVELSP